MNVDENFTVKEILIDLSHRVDRAYEEAKRNQEAQDKRLSALEAWREKISGNFRTLGVFIASVGTIAGVAYAVMSFTT